MATSIPRFAVLPGSPCESESSPQKTSMWDRVKKFGTNFLRDDSESYPSSSQGDDFPRPGVTRRLSRKVIPGLPRPGTFRRQQSEMRDNLTPHDAGSYEHRSVSVGRRRAISSARQRGPSPSPVAVPSLSAPEVGSTDDSYRKPSEPQNEDIPITNVMTFTEEPDTIPSVPGMRKEETNDTFDTQGDQTDFGGELEGKWILNLSMHFRDRSDREKFFITYFDDTAGDEADGIWRRVTVSCDYRGAEPGSLEQDLKNTSYQRDKCAKIYDAIRESLPDIKFYTTVTNLKLETRDGRLHVHVTEDIPELIQYPSVDGIQHLDCDKYCEGQLEFDSHLSGFVYKVRSNGKIFIKKEIPGPDAVEEFMYEINALDSLQGSNSVIKFGGVVLSDDEQTVKGLLIDYAQQGALVDILYDEKGHLNWKRRERWAKQIVEGLSEIHENGFVQGDFTLSNIVVDGNDDAKIIDINRRGCPVGWEPPEVSKLISSGQRISMYIGVKSDLFQLGMVLWALAQEVDEPEGCKRPLTFDEAGSFIPGYYRDLVETCLSIEPKRRASAHELLSRFPELIDDEESRPVFRSSLPPHYHSPGTSPPLEKQYIDPDAAVEREDLERFQQQKEQEHLRQQPGPGSDTVGDGTYLRRSAGDVTYVQPTTSATEISDRETAVARGRTGVHRTSIPDFDNGHHHLDEAPETSTAPLSPSDPLSPLSESDDHIHPRQHSLSVPEEAGSSPQIMTITPGDGEKWKTVESDGTSFLVRTITTPDQIPLPLGDDDEEYFFYGGPHPHHHSGRGGTQVSDATALGDPKAVLDEMKLAHVITPLSEDGGVLTGVGTGHTESELGTGGFQQQMGELKKTSLPIHDSR